MKRISALMAMASLLCACHNQMTEGEVLLDSPVTSSVEIAPYHQQWMEIFHVVVPVEPYTDYVLSGEAMSSLPTLRQGVFLGARFPEGDRVLKDKEYLVFHNEMTPMNVAFNSGALTEVMIFCGAWVNQTVSVTIDGFVLRRQGASRLTDAKPFNHFIPPVGWMNDPNGMVYKDDVFHLYYQHYPDEIGTIFSGLAV